MEKTKVFHVYKPGASSHYIEADNIKVAEEHIVFRDKSEAVLAVVATSPGLIVIDQESERGIGGFPR